jgi:hypothetical protein
LREKLSQGDAGHDTDKNPQAEIALE